MKVQYLLRFPQICAIHSMTGISGTISITPEDTKIVEYDISEEQKSMLDALLSQKGSVIKEDMLWPSQGNIYYYIDNEGSVLRGHWDVMLNGAPSRVDADRRNIGNIFKTEEETQFEVEKLKVLNQLKSLSDDDQEWDDIILHYHIAYNVRRNEFNVFAYSSVKLSNEYWFKSKESAENAIETIGKDKLKKYIFNVKEKTS